jgi:hypothetical protein
MTAPYCERTQKGKRNMENSDRVHLEKLKERAEEIYDEMYEASGPAAAGGYFSEVKEILYEAIGMAREMGLEDEAKEIEARLDHMRKVYESQMQ